MPYIEEKLPCFIRTQISFRNLRAINASTRTARTSIIAIFIGNRQKFLRKTWFFCVCSVFGDTCICFIIFWDRSLAEIQILKFFVLLGLQKFLTKRVKIHFQFYSFIFNYCIYNIAYYKLSSFANSASLMKYGDPTYFNFSIQLISLTSYNYYLINSINFYTD